MNLGEWGQEKSSGQASGCSRDQERGKIYVMSDLGGFVLYLVTHELSTHELWDPAAPTA